MLLAVDVGNTHTVLGLFDGDDLVEHGVTLELGGHRQQTLLRADLIVVSPGVKLDQPVLSAARDAGMAAPFACKAGVCATCRARVIAGQVEMAARYGLSDEEVAAGYVLTCQSVPVGEGVVVDYDA